MKKIPTLFERTFENNKVVRISEEPAEGLEWVFKGEGIATVKWDGACCALIDGELYKRYDAKHGKPIPEGAIKCQETADPVTGHFPCWVRCDRNEPSDKWFWEAFDKSEMVENGTYEAIGKHFNSNPYGMENDILIPHGKDIIEDMPRTFEGIKSFLKENDIEGVVFWLNGEPRCKVKRTDFGFKWNKKHLKNI